MPLNCPPGTTPTRTPDGLEVCAVRPFGCILPEVPVCEPGAECACRIPVSAMVCEVRIQYAQGEPTKPVIGGAAPWCDAAGIELALAVILARLLGAPPYP
jgi:hypothetical protein